jgi:CubicO group peptidase (beta-lactamase class C family)
MRNSWPGRMLLTLGLLGCSLAFAGQSDTGPAPDLVPIISQYRACIPELMEASRIPGLSVVLVADDQIAWIEGFGTTDGVGTNPVTADTFFSLQSNSKAFTALAVLMAVRDGQLDLDTPIAAYLPKFTIRSRFGEHPERTITLRQLLSHTAGLAHEAPIGNNYNTFTASFEDHIRSISRTWLRYPVGQRYAYSNLGIDLAGFILQQVSGKPFSACAREQLLAPIGMEKSSFDIQDIRRFRSRAVGHDTYLPRVSLEIPMIPSGGLYSSAREMGAFLLFHLQRGRVGNRRLIPGTLLEQMYKIPRPMPSQKNGYALGLYRELRHGTYSLSHNGGGFGFLSHMCWYPELGLGIAVLTNATGHSVHFSLGREILDAIIASRGLARRVPPTEPPREVTPDEALLMKLAGSYISERNVEWMLGFKDGTFGIRSGPGFYPLHFTSENEAFERDGDEIYRYRFQFDDRGKPAAIVLVDEGLIFDYNADPGDPPGPGRSEWDSYAGRYRMINCGIPVEMLTIRKRNGWLFADNLRLAEYSPGLFFACTGDVVDFSKPMPTARNIPIERNDIPLSLALVMGVCAAVLLLAGLGVILSPLVRHMKKRKAGFPPGPTRRSHRFADALAWTCSGMCLGYLGVVLFQYPMLIGYGMSWNPRFPLWMKVASLLPAGIGLLSLATAGVAVAAWREPAWPPLRRWSYSSVALALLIFTTIMFHWNLLRL